MGVAKAFVSDVITTRKYSRFIIGLWDLKNNQRRCILDRASLFSIMKKREEVERRN